MREERRVAVLGSSVRKQLFEKKPVPLGETVYIKDHPYEIVGVMPEKNQNSTYDGWDNDKILVPEPALLRDAPARREFYVEGRVDCLLYRPKDTRHWAEADAEVKAALGKEKDFDPHDEGALDSWNFIKESEMFDSIFDAGEIFLAVVALVTLSLGGIGVMNTMMMAVRERTNEIGLKKAVGATKGRITMEFFLEGLILAVLAGVIGLFLVWLLSVRRELRGQHDECVDVLRPADSLERAGAGDRGAGPGGGVLVAAAGAAAAELTPVEALRFER